jgi:hypothetical protein
MKKVSIRQAILDAIDDSDDQIARHMNTLLKWAKYCEKAIGSANGYPVKSSLHTVLDNHIDTPPECYKVIAMFPGDRTAEFNLQYEKRGGVTVHVENISDDTDLEYVWGNMSTTRIVEVLWDEVGDQVNIVDQYNNMKVTLVYQYIPTDDNGYWLVNETHVDAITKYLVYKYAKKFTFKNFKSSKLTRGADIQMVELYKRDYSHAIRNARALDGEENPMNTLG